MPDAAMIDRDSRLLQMLQSGFPLSPRPYDELGRQLGLRGAEVIAYIGKLKEGGLVRQIGPVIDGRRLGYHSTLLAMQIAPDLLAGAERIITAHRASATPTSAGTPLTSG